MRKTVFPRIRQRVIWEGTEGVCTARDDLRGFAWVRFGEGQLPLALPIRDLKPTEEPKP